MKEYKYINGDNETRAASYHFVQSIREYCALSGYLL